MPLAGRKKNGTDAELSDQPKLKWGVWWWQERTSGKYSVLITTPRRRSLTWKVQDGKPREGMELVPSMLEQGTQWLAVFLTKCGIAVDAITLGRMRVDAGEQGKVSLNLIEYYQKGGLYQ